MKIWSQWDWEREWIGYSDTPATKIKTILRQSPIKSLLSTLQLGSIWNLHKPTGEGIEAVITHMIGSSKEYGSPCSVIVIFGKNFAIYFYSQLFPLIRIFIIWPPPPPPYPYPWQSCVYSLLFLCESVEMTKSTKKIKDKIADIARLMFVWMRSGAKLGNFERGRR